MIAEHYDVNNNYARDYIYSSFDHAFLPINDKKEFVEWNKATLVKSAKSPNDYKRYWEHTTKY